jgi:hypothetical protein
MRGLFAVLAGLWLVGCGGASAEVTGTVGDVAFGETSYVYMGGPFIIISMLEVSCEGLDFVRRNYEVGMAPTDADTEILQFSFDEDLVATGSYPIDIDAAVSSTVIAVSGGAFYEDIARGGLLTVDTFSDEDSASGSFSELAFDGGTLSGSFSAEWCRNLKPR